MQSSLKIGLEIHGYLNTKEKLFCNCKAEHGQKFSKPNTNICPICTGMPGAKPMLANAEAVAHVLQAALILNCKINQQFQWQRKHYDWPDLPKGYQNTNSGKYTIPIGTNGSFQGIKIKETHLEEDPSAWNPETGEIDYNRSGSLLIEIVTQPDFGSSLEVIQWLKQLTHALSYIKAIDNNSGIKADVNVSLNNGERVEIKNMNSLENIKAAIEYEEKHQSKQTQKTRETKAFNPISGETITMRTKEGEADYRFISDPDLPIVKINSQIIENIKNKIPETPQVKLERLIKKHKIDEKSAEVLAKNIDIVEFFEQVITKIPIQTAVPWVTIELLRILNYNKKSLDEVDIQASHFIELLEAVIKKEITELKAKQILNEFIPRSFSIKEKIKTHKTISSEKEIEDLALKVIKNNPKAVQDYKEGKPNAINFLIGELMKLSNKRADYKTAKEILEKLLK
ncbi:MAG: Asp-tRNA(Asn)/Glu-tRNA(Gln) amidotransferase subunit GatB [Nanoarchaeota archaeon]